MRRRLAIFGLIGITVLGGCRRRAAVPPPPPATQQVAVTAPATRPAQAVPATFVINGQAFVFPAAKLVSVVKDGSLRVTLFSHDPPEAVRDDYTGNSFYFRFTFDIDNADDLAGQQQVYRNSYAEQEETTSGLFVAGGRQTLRPLESTVTFDRLDSQMVVHVGGTFRLRDNHAPGDEALTVKVEAMLEPTAGDIKR